MVQFFFREKDGDMKFLIAGVLAFALVGGSQAGECGRIRCAVVRVIAPVKPEKSICRADRVPFRVRLRARLRARP